MNNTEATSDRLLDMSWLAAIVARQDEIFSLQPSCPRCSTQQVQIINMHIRPAEWKCRMCKTKFTADADSPANAA